MNKSPKEGAGSSVAALSAVVLLWVIHCLLNYVWIAKDTWYPFTDSYDFFHMSNLIYMHGGGSVANFLKTVVEVCKFRPPLVFLGPVPLFSLFGVSYKVCLIPNFAYLLILMLSVYGIGSRLFGKPQGLLAAFLVSTYPEIISLSRIYLLDLPTLAFITLSIFALLLTRRFRSLPYSLLFGAVFGLAFLVKWTSLVFIIPPAAVWFLWPSGNEGGKWPDMKQIRNVLLACATFLLLVSWWIVPNLKPVVAEIINRSVGYKVPYYSLGVPLFHPKRLLYYVIVVLSQDFVFFVVFCIGMMTFIWSSWRRGEVRSANTMLLFAWILVPYAVFIYSPKVWPRFVAPLVPPLCLIASAGLLSLKNDRIRRRTVFLSVSFCAIGVTSLTFAGYNRLESGESESERVRSVFRFAYPVYEKFYAGHPSIEYFDTYTRPFKEDDWKVRATLGDVSEAAVDSDTVTIAVLSHHPFFHHGAFEYFGASLDSPKVEIKKCGWAPKPIDDDVLASDFVVLKTGFNGARFAIKEIDRFLEDVRTNPGMLNSTFNEISHYSLPDGSVAKLYGRKE